MKTSILCFLLLCCGLLTRAQTGSVTNIRVSQRTDGSGLVDVIFDLTGKATYNILLEVRFNNDQTYAPVSVNFIEGDTEAVTPGVDKHIIWNGQGSFPNTFSTKAMLKIIASEELPIQGDWPRDTQTQVVEVFNPATGKTWMDRNLGASRAATSSTDEESYGDLYQWGRAADGHQIRTSDITSTLSNSDTPGHGNFIVVRLGYSDWRSPGNDNLWQGVNGTNNPCPVGYRLPTEAELNAERASWGSNNTAGAFASPLKLPVAGIRYDGWGTLGHVGSAGVYWSSTVYSRSLEFDSIFAGMYNPHRASGSSVRCIKD
jgi:hypothetical protein